MPSKQFLKNHFTEQELAEYKRVKDLIWICPYCDCITGKKEEHVDCWYQWLSIRKLMKKNRPDSIYDAYKKFLRDKMNMLKAQLSQVTYWGDNDGISLKLFTLKQIELLEAEEQSIRDKAPKIVESIFEDAMKRK